MKTADSGRISVAMAVYNGAAFLPEQLRSLADQTRPPDRVIICDDGSRDDSVELIRQFIRERDLENWTLVENRENLGYIRNFRKAMDLAEGDIVFLCDQDDIWEPEKIRTMASVMESDPRILALAGGYRLIDEAGRPIPGKKFYDPGKRGPVSPVNMGPFFYENMAQGCACAYRSSLVQEYCGSGESMLPHDWALNLLAYRKGGLFFLKEELLRYRIHGSNTTGIAEPQGAVTRRIPRLAEYLSCVEAMESLPLTARERQEAEAIAAFTRGRIRWLRERRLGLWLNGARSPIWRRYFFRQYCKDLALVLLGKIPPSPDGKE